MQNSNYRIYIQIHQSQGKDAKTIFNELKTCSPQHALSHPTVKYWFREFRRGQQSLEDKHQPGAPITKTFPTNIKNGRDLIVEDPYLKYDEIEAQTSLSRDSILAIIHEHLEPSNKTSRWMPHNLAQTKIRTTGVAFARKIWPNSIRVIGVCTTF